MILIIDNYDSFTYNLCQLVASLGFDVVVKKHDEVTAEDIEELKPEKIIISPGPKRPEDAGVSIDIIKYFYKTIPILGVCLGHQCIGHLFGEKIVHAKEVLHGKTWYRVISGAHFKLLTQLPFSYHWISSCISFKVIPSLRTISREYLPFK